MGKVFEVRRHASAKDRYFVNAESDSEAIEKVTLRLADLEGVEAWTAVQAEAPFEFHPGDVVDGSGKPVKSVDLGAAARQLRSAETRMDQPVDAFRISLRHPVPGTSKMTDKAVLVVARSQADAVAIARQACPVPCSAQILQHGPDVLREARKRGLEIGGFIELQSR